MSSQLVLDAVLLCVILLRDWLHGRYSGPEPLSVASPDI
jgi:hypothetical protein